MATSNAINANSTGLVRYNGTGTFDAVTTTNRNVLVGASSNGITNVAPSATSGVPLISQGASSDPTFGTAVVAGGGTGVTSATAYAVLCGGTTSTNPFQSIAGVGTSGQVLTSNGASALPTFQDVGIGLSATVTLTSAQVKALRATPIQIVAAAGSGKVIRVISCMAKMVYAGVNAFTNGQTCALSYDTAGTIFAATSVLNAASINNTATNYNLAQAANQNNVVDTTIENQPVYIKNIGASEITGNAANDNTVVVYVNYIVVSI